MAAQMLCAYYDRSCDSLKLFEDLDIANDPSFEKHLNKYPVIYLDMTRFVTRYKNKTVDITQKIDAELRADIGRSFPDVHHEEDDDLMALLIRITIQYSRQFIFIIDDWDAISRAFPADTQALDHYISWLRRMFKSSDAMRVFAGVYITGILPVKKYKTESGLNNFREYSMLDPIDTGSYFGFTKNEVKMLADRHNTEYNELEQWYDGYQIGDGSSVFNPNSVMSALRSQRCRNFWAATGTYEELSDYINMNYSGLKEDIVQMLSGVRCFVDPTGFHNDISHIKSKDDVLTLLIHLGYLSYDWRHSECYIPNREAADEILKAVNACN